MKNSINKLLLLPGALGASIQFDKFKTELSPFFEVFSYNYPRHGFRQQSDFNTFSMETLSKDVIHFIKENHIQKCTVLGHSMGGYLAVFTEITHPGTFNSIITYGTKWYWDEAFAAKETRKLSVEFFEQKAPEFLQYLNQLHGEDSIPFILEKTQDIMNQLGKKPLIKSLEDIQSPIRIIRGSLDRMVQDEESIEISNTSTLAKYIELENQPHAIQEVDSEILVKEILLYQE